MSPPRSLRIVADADAAPSRTTIVERGCYRTIVSDHPAEVYLASGNAKCVSSGFYDPLAALEIAAALIDAASQVLDRQFRKQMGGS